ncbi:hypothetical protein R1sor_010188 [Riccia sorocarpa]|uniref:Malectin-like domain-containing protein n=1 Tax=Riccia sorocarpa TaxID=122646 RepID=A0ABD3I003_9MARC
MAAGKLFFAGIFLCCELLQPGAAQTGFISIDCGSTVSYTDGLGIDWVGDEGYASNGANAVIDTKKANLGPDALTDRNKLQTLRYFPEPAGKFCYDIPVGTAGQYLIRMSFLAGNWSSDPANFSVSLGAAHWQDLTIDDPWTPTIKEANFVALQVNLPSCFQRGASGVPVREVDRDPPAQ